MCRRGQNLAIYYHRGRCYAHIAIEMKCHSQSTFSDQRVHIRFHSWPRRGSAPSYSQIHSLLANIFGHILSKITRYIIQKKAQF